MQGDLFAVSDDLAQVRDLVRRGALFVINDSGGKDSQAMKIKVRRVVPAAQLIVVHADLGADVEWEGAQEHIEQYNDGLPLIVARSVTGFFEKVEHRGMFPDPGRRWCTSDLKRGPIEREVRRYLKAHPEFGGLIVNCMGMRAQESPGRAKLVSFKRNDMNSKAGRQWFEWLPIHDWSIERVFETIAEADQEPHPIYAKGMSRFSCRFCIMANAKDLTTAAKLAPLHYARMVATERRLGFTLSPSRKTLPEITGIAA